MKQVISGRDAYRILRASFEAPEGRTGRYLNLVRLTAFLKEQVVALQKPAVAPAASREVPDWFALSPAEFEHAVAELCRRDGCTRVQTAGDTGDLGADVIAYSPDEHKIVIQCKQYQGKVSSPDLQKFAGTVFHLHHAEVGLLVTTGALTAPAAGLAQSIGIRIVAADRLDGWAQGGQPLWA